MLSKRLSAIASQVTAGNVLADVGTDHGYIPIELVSKGIIPKAIALDINKGPLERAKEHIALTGLGEKIETRLSDGLEYYEQGECDTILIAGMGGALTVHILSAYPHKLEGVKELVLSPQSEIYLVRGFLCENGFRIVSEQMLEEDGKYYTIMRAIPEKETHTYEGYELEYGYVMLEEKDEVALAFLKKRREKLQQILQGLSAGENSRQIERREELGKELEDVEKALRRFEA